MEDTLATYVLCQLTVVDTEPPTVRTTSRAQQQQEEGVANRTRSIKKVSFRTHPHHSAPAQRRSMVPRPPLASHHRFRCRRSPPCAQVVREVQPHLPHDRLWGAAGGRGGMRGWPGEEIIFLFINIFLFFPGTLFTVLLSLARPYHVFPNSQTRFLSTSLFFYLRNP